MPVSSFSLLILPVLRLLPDRLLTFPFAALFRLFRRARSLILELRAELGYRCSTELQLVYSSIHMPQGTGQPVESQF